MAINYARSRANATRMIKENGMMYNLERPGNITVVSGKEVIQPTQYMDVVGIRSDYELAEIDGTLIKSGDVRIAFSAETEIMTGDLLEVDGKQHRVVKPNPQKPGSIVLCYQAQLRA